MSWGKFLPVMMLCAGGMQGALIVSGTVTTSQVSPSNSAGTSGVLVLSDGATINNYSSSSGNIVSACYDFGQGCTFNSFNSNGEYYGFYGLQFITLGFDYGNRTTASAQLFATIDPSFHGYSAVRGLDNQTFQIAFTATGSANNYYPTNPPCPFPDAPLNSCLIPISGSGIATFTVSEAPKYSALDALYVSKVVYTFSSVPEPGTPILITAGIGVLALMRKRFSVRQK